MSDRPDTDTTDRQVSEPTPTESPVNEHFLYGFDSGEWNYYVPKTRGRASEVQYVSWYGGQRRQSWGTPPEFFARLHDRFEFTLDGASEPGNGLLPRSSTAEQEIRWEGERVFCNPPWSNIPAFVEQAATASLAVLLVPARTNCRWFHRALELGAQVEFFKPKPKFVGAKHTSPVDCLLLVFTRTASLPPEPGSEGGRG